ncbi:MAG: glycosyltransferase family 2 protein [Thermomicrobiales bacterium]
MNQNPLVSIIVNNYNYDQFLPVAIESALAQAYPLTQVIVVDDGSTDDSRAVIARYGDRITPVLKGNGGQASAFNAGFASSDGEIIIFLDADDTLLPHIAGRVVEVFQARPDIVSVHYRLSVVDADGAPTGRFEPPAFCHMPNGDVRPQLRTMFDHIPWPATSGNAWSAHVLSQFFPLDEQDIRGCTDYYVQRATALFGPVISLEDEVGGCYRVHGSNSFYRTKVDLDQLRWNISSRVFNAYEHIWSLADSLGLDVLPRNFADLSDYALLARRLISIKLDPKRHPYREDSLPSLCWRGILALLRAPDLSPPYKMLHILWFAALAASPRPFAWWLAQQFQTPPMATFRARLKLPRLSGSSEDCVNR